MKDETITATIIHDGIEYTATVMDSSVFVDTAGHWLGDGTISATGRIEDIAATLPEEAFEALEDALFLARRALDAKILASLYIDSGLG
jgi:hypothetical protein